MNGDRSSTTRVQRIPQLFQSASLHTCDNPPSASSTTLLHEVARLHYPLTRDNYASAYIKPLIALIVLAATVLLCVALVALAQKDPAASLNSFQSLLPALTAANATAAAAATTACTTASSSSIAAPTLDDVTADPTLAFAPHPALKPTPEFLSTLPSRCGNWMADYAAFHASVSTGRYFLDQLNTTGVVPTLPLLVYRADPKARLGGISDRWPPLSTAMLLAVLTRRAIYIDWPGYDAAYTHTHLPYLTNTTWRGVYYRWQWYVNNADIVKAALLSNTPPPAPPAYSRSFPPIIAPNHTLDTTTHDNGLIFPPSSAIPAGHIAIETLTSLDELRRHYQPAVPIVYVTQTYWSKGLIRKFYAVDGGGAMRTVMIEGLGLKENVCHGCMINFLLNINRQVMTMFAPYALRLRQLGVQTVGLQIRMGDASMTGVEGLSEKLRADLAWQQDDTQLLPHIQKWTNCATQLLDLHATTATATNHSSSLLFLVSDNTRVRGLLQSQYGDRLLAVPTGSAAFPIGHTDTGDRKLFNVSRSSLQVERAGQYLRVAAGEQWLLAYCDWLVIEHEGSGFGRSASMRSVRVGHTWNGRGKYRCDGEVGALTAADFDRFGHRY